MPPWPPRDDCRPLLSPRHLTDAQIATIGAWVDAGLAEGDPADGVAPPEPAPFDGDVVLPMPEPYGSPAGGDDYRCFVVDWPEPEERYVVGYEVEPGRRDLVHHVILFTAEPGRTADQAHQMDLGEAGPGYTCYGSSGVFGAETLGGWVPGVRGVDLPEGTGIRLAPGTALIVQVHYNTIAVDDPGTDLTSVALHLADAVERPAAAMLVLGVAVPRPDVDPGGRIVGDPRGDVLGSHPGQPGDRHRRRSRRADPAAPGVVAPAHARAAVVADARAGGRGRARVPARHPGLGLRLAGRLHVRRAGRARADEVRLSCEWDNSAPGAVDVDWGEGTGDEMCLAGLYVTQ